MKINLTSILLFLFIVQLSGQDYHVKNPKTDYLFDIEEWRYDDLQDIEGKFNLARSHENLETNSNLPNFSFPNNWEKYSVVKKIKWLVDKERKDRHQIALDNINTKLNKLSKQSSKHLVDGLGSDITSLNEGASVLLLNNDFYIEDIEQADLKNNKENLEVNQLITLIKDVKNIPVVEMLFFNWIYADSDNDWINREFVLSTKFNENGGDPYKEGFIGASLMNFSLLGQKDNLYALSVQFYDPDINWNYGIRTNTFESLDFKVITSEGMMMLNIDEVSDSLSVEVYNLLGQQVLEQKLDYGVNNSFPIDGPKGYYLVKVTANTKSKAVKVYVP